MTIETIDTVEVAESRICSICGKTIEAHETHSEEVEVDGSGEIVKVISWYHNECPE